MNENNLLKAVVDTQEKMMDDFSRLSDSIQSLLVEEIPSDIDTIRELLTKSTLALGLVMELLNKYQSILDHNSSEIRSHLEVPNWSKENKVVH